MTYSLRRLFLVVTLAAVFFGFTNFQSEPPGVHVRLGSYAVGGYYAPPHLIVGCFGMTPDTALVVLAIQLRPTVVVYGRLWNG